MILQFQRRIAERFDSLVRVRRHLHRHPEVSFQERKTARYIIERYETLGIDVQYPVGSNGIVATLRGAQPGKTIALRADFDALPIHDEKRVDYRSTVDGVMHACGHDGHTSSLLHIAEVLAEMKDELTGQFVFIHQHAEELSPGGAIEMIKDGCLNGVDEIYATHIWSTNPLGTIECKTGPIMAAADRFTIHIQGKGGHGAAPHTTKDAIVIASSLIVQMQTIISRMTDPLQPSVLSVGKVEAGQAFNIIADEATIVGTARSFTDSQRTLIERELQKMCDAFQLMYDCTITLDFLRGYPPLVNDHEATEAVRRVVDSLPSLTYVPCEPYMAGEDFAYYTERIRGALFFTGAQLTDRTPYPHHHPKFDFDERALVHAATLLGTIAIQRANS